MLISGWQDETAKNRPRANRDNMSKELLQRLMLIAGILLIQGCTYSQRFCVREPATPAQPGGEILTTPPVMPPRPETVETPPNEPRAWVKGYWLQSNHQWMWVPGHWEPIPKSS